MKYHISCGSILRLAKAEACARICSNQVCSIQYKGSSCINSNTEMFVDVFINQKYRTQLSIFNIFFDYKLTMGC